MCTGTNTNEIKLFTREIVLVGAKGAGIQGPRKDRTHLQVVAENHGEVTWLCQRCSFDNLLEGSA